jgi:3-oxoadipate enol-lactonase
MIVSTPFDGFAGCAAALSDYDLRPGLAGIRTPFLLITGTKDPAAAGIQQIKAALPGTRLIELEGAGHICNVEQPAFFTRSVLEFLNG